MVCIIRRPRSIVLSAETSLYATKEYLSNIKRPLGCGNWAWVIDPSTIFSKPLPANIDDIANAIDNYKRRPTTDVVWLPNRHIPYLLIASWYYLLLVPYRICLSAHRWQPPSCHDNFFLSNLDLEACAYSWCSNMSKNQELLYNVSSLREVGFIRIEPRKAIWKILWLWIRKKDLWNMLELLSDLNLKTVILVC